MQDQKVIGIVGGGQLAKNLTYAALPLGFKVVVVEPEKSCVAKQAGAECIDASVYDAEALLELGRRCDYITIEIEHLKTDTLEEISKKGLAQVYPAAQTIRLIQDKFAQKEFFARHALPLGKFQKINAKQDISDLLKYYGSPLMLKTCFGAYNGLGNVLIKNSVDADTAWKKFSGVKLYAEKFIPFSTELAVMAARDVRGNVALHPIVETVHKRNICHETIAPARISDDIKKQVFQIANKVLSALEDVGIFGIEMFVTEDGEVLLNEVAPRVHNSGHYSLDACTISQFEQHIRAITGLPLGNPELLKPAVVMVNILGERNGPTYLTGVDQALKQTGVAVHIYGKSPTKIDRKMGHLNAWGEKIDDTLAAARKARKHINI